MDLLWRRLGCPYISWAAAVPPLTDDRRAHSLGFGVEVNIRLSSEFPLCYHAVQLRRSLTHINMQVYIRACIYEKIQV